MACKRQLPDGGQIFLDHVAHFVPEIDAAAKALECLGFRLTPLTAQVNRTEAGPVPAGMANRCAMLRQGYLEFLTAISDTPLARRFQTAVSRYTGLHLIAFAVAEAERAQARLEERGFAPEPPVHLRRPVELPDGETGEAAFTVVRVPPEAMPEGRVQILTHHSEEVVWQPRWSEHPNAIVSLQAAVLIVADPEGVAKRYGRFADRVPEEIAPGRWRLRLDRGLLVFMDPETGAAYWPEIAPPSMPWIAGYALGSSALERTHSFFTAEGKAIAEAEGEKTYWLPPVLGGFATVTESGVLPRWAR